MLFSVILKGDEYFFSSKLIVKCHSLKLQERECNYPKKEKENIIGLNKDLKSDSIQWDFIDLELLM